MRPAASELLTLRHRMFRNVTRAAPLLLPLLITACAAPPPAPEPLAEPAPPAQQASQTAEIPSEETIQPPALPEPGLLLGLEPRQMQEVLGSPALVRREGAAQVMQFSNGDCALNITFYEESAGGAFRAHHLSSRMTDGREISPQHCLADILPGGQYPADFFPEEILPEEPAPEVEAEQVPAPDRTGPDS